MRVAEIYPSIQGEGRYTGEASVFVRASGCNLRCWYCDTPYASWQPEGEDLSVDEIVAQVLDHEAEHVVLAGGEPMLFAELVPICRHLKEAGRIITIETAGTLHLSLACDLMSISPKLSNSSPAASHSINSLESRAGGWAERHDRTRHAPSVIRRLVDEYDYQFKFVIDTPEDCEEVVQYLKEFPEVPRHHVWMMPQGTAPEQLKGTGDWLEPWCRTHGYHYCPRKQIEWFGLVRGT